MAEGLLWVGAGFLELNGVGFGADLGDASHQRLAPSLHFLSIEQRIFRNKL